MPFDANLVLIDGTIDFAPATDTAPTSTTVDETTGAVVIDLKETGVRGLAAVLILPVKNDADDSDTLTGFIEASDVLAFTSDLHKLCSFDIAGATTGVILASEGPAVVIARFVTTERYVRVNMTAVAVSGSADFGKLKVLLSPYPFKVL